MEALGYAFGAVPFPSAGVGAPHIRDRLFWVADSANQRQHGRRTGLASNGRNSARFEPERLCDVGRMAYANYVRFESAAIDGVHDTKYHTEPCGSVERLGDTDSKSTGRNSRATHAAQTEYGSISGHCDGPGNADRSLPADRPACPVNGFWRNADWLRCRDDKWRPVRPGTFPLVNGAPSRVGRLRAYGNAISAEAAKEFIAAYLECQP